MGSRNMSDFSKPNEGTFKDTISTISKEFSQAENNYQNQCRQPLWKCRYVAALLGFFIYFLLSIYRTNTSVSIVAMVNNSAITQQAKSKSESCPHLIRNITEGDKIGGEGDFMWSPRIQGYVLGSYFFGYVIAQFPTGRLAERFGCKWFLFWSSIATAVCTLLIPVLSWLSVSGLVVVQAVRGSAQGFVQPSMSILTANWFPKVERGLLFAIMHSGASMGTCFGSILSGFLCESSGKWPSSFYAVGVAGIILSVSIFFFLVENPQAHPRITKAEMDFIQGNQENILTKRRPTPPWKKILTSVPVYALSYAYFGQLWAISQFMVVHSLFLGTILHYPIGQNGLFTAVPFLLQFICSQVGAWISYYLQQKEIAGVNFLRKFWNFIASLGFSLCLFGIYFSECNRTLSVVFAILSTGFTGFGFVGCWIVSTDMTPTFAGSIHAIGCTFGFSASFILPLIVGYLTDEMQTIEQWNKVFFITIAIVMSSGISFVIFGSAEVQPWNFASEDISKGDEKRLGNDRKMAEKEIKETSRF